MLNIQADTDPRWAQLVARDKSSDTQFVYSVVTTGVYCRPSCAARTPNPRNVRFHATTQAAEAAGFRPCLRCKPNQPAEDHTQKIAQICRLIEESEQPLKLATLAIAANLSRHHFHRLFKSTTGVTPRLYAAAHRARRLRESLTAANSVTEAIYDSGFNTGSRFYEAVDATLGMTPTQFRAGAAGQTIRFTTTTTSLGTLLVAETPRGICAILLGDDPTALVQDLHQSFPKATLIATPAQASHLAQVIALIEQPGTNPTLPLDIRGTAFQQRVWHLLRQIPPGTTTSYTDLARALGTPRSARAVAGACAANKLAVAIPCHRVVRSNGDLAGYRWGLARKQALLTREK